MNIMSAVVVFIALGGVVGLLLAFASDLFKVESDERIDKIKECLPGANCGGCGYAGCSAFAEAIVKGEAVASCCVAANKRTSDAIASIMGVEAELSDKKTAYVMCSGYDECACKKYEYDGISDCRAASLLGGGEKSCIYGCLGLGTCVSVCPFSAIEIKDGIAKVDYLKCCGCGACIKVCPKGLIELIPLSSKNMVACKSAYSAKEIKKVCSAGCIGCGICVKSCPQNAVSILNNVAKIDYNKCISCGICASKCPKKVIQTVNSFQK